VTSENEVSLK